MPKLSAKELIEVLERRYHFYHNDREELEDINEDILDMLGDNGLVFNYAGDWITECEEPEIGEPSVEDIYKFIRRSGWSLEENPLDMEAWILFPTDQLDHPITSLLDDM